MKKNVKVTRRTKESDIMVCLDFSSLRSNYKEYINTPEAFLNHMIEHIAYRGQFNIEVSVRLDKFDLKHVIFEDIGTAFGKAVKAYIEANLSEGIPGFGSGTGIIDEAGANVSLSFEDRTYFVFSSGFDMPAETEGTLSEDLETFLEGFAQGARCAVHIDAVRGRNGHHIWEAVYRAFGIALKNSLKPDEERKNLTSGVCGTVDYEIEVK